MRIELAPPELREVRAKFGEEDVCFLIRPFTLADLGWLHRRAGNDSWYPRVLQGDSELAIEIFAHQIENQREIAQKLGGESSLADTLSRYLLAGETQYKAIITAISEAYIAGLPAERAKKKMLKRGKWILTGLLLGLSIAGLAAWGISYACRSGRLPPWITSLRGNTATSRARKRARRIGR